MACDSVWNTTPIALDHVDAKALAAALTGAMLPEAERWRVTMTPTGLTATRAYGENLTLEGGRLTIALRQSRYAGTAANEAERDAIAAKVRQAYGAQVSASTLVRYGLKIKKIERIAATDGAIRLTFNRTGR